MGKTYGYIRVSSIDQNESRQRLAMQERAIADEHLFIDKLSGKDFHRPRYLAMLRRLKPGCEQSRKLRISVTKIENGPDRFF